MGIEIFNIEETKWHVGSDRRTSTALFTKVNNLSYDATKRDFGTRRTKCAPDNWVRKRRPRLAESVSGGGATRGFGTALLRVVRFQH